MNSPIVARAGSRHGLLLIVLAAVLWGTVGTAVKIIYGLAETNPFSIGFFRLAFSVPVQYIFRTGLERPCSSCWGSRHRQSN